ncbi:uncharacterized protein [Dysidea avara]|uniref:uncharacterized protein n=1 Tax=Dysidea avara TaxID=196820 RepID=UPI00332A42C9
MELEATGESVGLYDIYTGDIEPMVIDGSNHTERDQVSNEATLQEDSLSISSITDGESTDNSRVVALWLLKLKEVHGMPQSAMSTITEEVQTLFDSVIENIGCQIGTMMDSAANMAEAKLLIHQHLYSATSRLFRGFQTPAQQLTYFRDNFNLVRPTKIKMGTRRIHRGHGRKRRLKEVTDTLVYVPLLKTLQMLLKDEGIYTEVQKGHTSTTPERLTDFCDGAHYFTHPLFNEHPTALQIFLYYDDVEVCNPLGSSKGKHKLAAFYFGLGNITPSKRSKLKGIQLLALCKSRTLKKYGMSKENGYDLVTFNGPQKVFGSLAVVIADNPASAALGGFKESASAQLPCRHCLGTAEEIKIHFDEDHFELRSSHTHETHLQAIDDDPSQSRECGLYPDKSVIPKMHYLIHTPRLISKFGPLSRLWALRFEAKHKYFKKIAQRLGNYINLPWTLANRHQMLQCFYHTSQKSLFEEETEVGPGSLVAERDRPLSLRGNSDCFRAKWIKLAGQKYQTSHLIMMEAADGEYPKFAKIENIYISNSKILLDSTTYETISYCNHYHSYEVKETSISLLVDIEKLPYVYTEILQTQNSKHFVIVRYHIAESV